VTGRGDFLEARDGRQRELDLCLGQAGPEAASILFLSTNVPGPDKQRPGISRLLREALAQAREALGLRFLGTGRDLLGPFHIGYSRVPPMAAKRAAMAMEAALPAGRLLDLDVYRPDGSQVGRAGLALPPRPCLVCPEPARECILLRRHSRRELLARVDALLEPWAPRPQRVDPEALAANLALGALGELDLTPKPGLVDRRDSGSHSDLSHPAMRASIDLLPLYFAELLDCHRQRRPLAAFVAAGLAAEGRMLRSIQSNAHRGFIFLSGVLLMAVCRCGGRIDGLRAAVAEVARGFFAQAGPADTHGAGIRDRHGLGGVRGEAERGLPAVFEHGWPKYREALEAGWDPDHAGFQLMAVLMQQVEDTTAVRRCGLEGLSRLRQDGACLQRLLEQGRDPEPWLAALNQDYRKSGLTMGGVADCMALVFALQATAQ
jgi:triphosphoribosyl-dephospho-CoA synthase